MNAENSQDNGEEKFTPTFAVNFFVNNVNGKTKVNNRK